MLAVQLYTTVINTKVLNYNVTYEVFPAVLLTVQDWLDVTLSLGGWFTMFSGSPWCLNLQGSSSPWRLDCVTLEGESTFF